MEILPLYIRKQPDASFNYRLSLHGETREFTTPQGSAEMAEDIPPQLHVKQLMPSGLCDVLRQWELAHRGKEKSLCLIESTFVTDRNGSFDAARDEALKRLAAFDCAIDVAQSRCEVQPMG